MEGKRTQHSTQMVVIATYRLCLRVRPKFPPPRRDLIEPLFAVLYSALVHAERAAPYYYTKEGYKVRGAAGTIYLPAAAGPGLLAGRLGHMSCRQFLVTVASGL